MQNTEWNEADTRAGQAVYSKTILRLYDWFVLGVSNRFIWKCPSQHMLDLYNSYISSKHLDIGVGTGYFLDRCNYSREPDITLLDLNQNCLDTAARRIHRLRPKVVRRDVCKKLKLEDGNYQSVGLNYVLHCLPGSLSSKAIVFDHISPHLQKGGVIFGSTLLNHGVDKGFLAKRLMRVYNRKKIFSNREDDPVTLEEILKRRFVEVEVKVEGCVALFVGYKS